jgi:hypothetical protein
MSWRSGISQSNIVSTPPYYSINQTNILTSGTVYSVPITLSKGLWSVTVNNILAIGSGTGTIRLTSYSFGISGVPDPLMPTQISENLVGSLTPTFVANQNVQNGNQFTFLLTQETTVQLFQDCIFTVTGTGGQTISGNQDSIFFRIN